MAHRFKFYLLLNPRETILMLMTSRLNCSNIEAGNQILQSFIENEPKLLNNNQLTGKVIKKLRTKE